jgi:multidrug efflux pump subunit AcrB
MSLPVSLLGSVALLGVAGETINLISLAAMILVLGIVVDDSINQYLLTEICKLE